MLKCRRSHMGSWPAVMYQDSLIEVISCTCMMGFFFPTQEKITGRWQEGAAHRDVRSQSRLMRGWSTAWKIKPLFRRILRLTWHPWSIKVNDFKLCFKQHIMVKVVLNSCWLYYHTLYYFTVHLSQYIFSLPQSFTTRQKTKFKKQSHIYLRHTDSMSANHKNVWNFVGVIYYSSSLCKQY